MTQSEAIQAMNEGHKVRHRLYTPEEYIYKNDKGVFVTEDGYKLNWIRYTSNSAFYNDWEIVKE